MKRNRKSEKFLWGNPTQSNERLFGKVAMTCDCGAPTLESPHQKNCAMMKPDWSKRCGNCGERPIVPVTGLCGPCTFGEASTAKGNW